MKLQQNRFLLHLNCWQISLEKWPPVSVDHKRELGSHEKSWRLTYWGQLMHIYVSRITNIGSDNGLSPGRRQAIIWTNVGILLIRTLRTNFSEILSAIHTFSFKKMHLKMSSAKWRPFCLCLIVLKDQCVVTMEAVMWALLALSHISSPGNSAVNVTWIYLLHVMLAQPCLCWRASMSSDWWQLSNQGDIQHGKQNTVWCHYNMVHFVWILHKRYPVAHWRRWDMEGEVFYKFRHLTYILPQALQ